MTAPNFRNLIAYKKAFALAMEIFRIAKRFPKEERYALTDQIRRSSRSVCSNIGEAYRKDNMRHILSVRFLMLILKTPRRGFGWILRLPVNILMKTSGVSWIQRPKKLEDF